MQIHVLRLQCPGTAAALIPERPEDRHENVNNRQTAKCAETFPAERLFQESETAGADVDEFFATEPKENCRHHHHDTGQAKGPARPKARIMEENRAEDGGDKRAGVDRKIKPAENLRKQVLVRLAKLVADVGRNARLDATGAKGNEAETDQKPEAGFIQRQREMAKAINNREPEDGLVFPDETLRQDGAENGKKINRRDEKGEILPRLRVAHVIGRAAARDQILGHENDQDGAHPVEGKTLGRLVPDDVGHARRHGADVRRSRARIDVWPWRCFSLGRFFASLKPRISRIARMRDQVGRRCLRPSDPCQPCNPRSKFLR